MEIELESPYKEVWNRGYLVVNKEGRKTLILYNSKENRSSTQYARYLISVKLGRFLTKEETVDHIDNDKSNDNLENLQLLSRKENLLKGLKLRYPSDRSNLKHGTLSMYRYCKCELCKNNKREYNKKNKPSVV